MEAAIGAASGLIGSLLNQLSNEFIQAYVASSELGLNASKIKDDLMFTQGLLHEAQRRGMSDNPGLQGLLQKLGAKADAAENALDELHYFTIQDQLDGTKYAEPNLGDGLRAHARHGRHAARYTTGNWLNCFSRSPMQDDGASSTDVKSRNKTNLGSSNDGPPDKLPFDRVAMSKKIKSVIEEIHCLCDPVSKLLTITPHQSNTPNVNLNRPLMGSTSVEKKLYGRSVIFEQTIKDITSGTCRGETLSVLPIVGPGGIGKTTFTQYLYNDKRTEEHFTVRVWVCVSTDFDVLKLTQQIHGCIPAAEKEGTNVDNGSTNLNQLQKSIENRLKSRRFLIVLDDVWKCDSDHDWNSLLAPFTKGEAKGSMVLVTTRFPKIEEMVKKGTSPINLQGLDPHEFFVFFRACVFGEDKPSQEYNELADIGKQIARKLKCSPLAAKTVARLLKKHLSWEHWRKVLENNEWQNETNKDDIMPALKISYDFLPFHLKQCFSYFCLFPEDHRFKVVDINRFWTALGIIDSSCKNKNYLEELVDSGFLMKEVNDLEDPCYVMHDLLHELSRSVSSQKCANISSSGFSAENISPSTRHLSIIIEDKYNANFRQEMDKLKSRIHISHLWTLMIFGGYDKRIVDIVKDTFSEIEDIRVLFIVIKTTESLPKKFSKLLHLRYLQIRAPPYCVAYLPSTLSRFYHLIFLDLQDWTGNSNLPKYFTHLVNLRHLIANHKLLSDVPGVGKIEHLEELKAFHVRKQSVGFELEELGKLKELGGELSIYNLHKVATKGEANAANLASKRNLKKLGLFWDADDWNYWDNNSDDDVADGFQPHDNLRELTIGGHGGAGPPSWLCRDIPMRYLEFLTLMDVSWCTLPPFGQLPYLKRLELCSIDRMVLIEPDYGAGRNQSFMHLKEVVFLHMPLLERWSVQPNCRVFPALETIECCDCPSLVSLSILPAECSLSCARDIHCPSLRTLKIKRCPKLLVSPVPPAPALTSIELCDTHRTVTLIGSSLEMNGYNGALAFHNLATPLTGLSLVNCDILTVDVLNLLSTAASVKELAVSNDENHPSSIAVDLFSELARRTKQLPAGCFQLEKLRVDSISTVLVAPAVCSHLSATLHTLTISYDQRVESLTAEEEEALQLFTSLQTLDFESCPGLPSLPQGLHSLSSLYKLKVQDCPQIQSLPKMGLPSSLGRIQVEECSAELHEQVMKLKWTNLGLTVDAEPKDHYTFSQELDRLDGLIPLRRPHEARLPASHPPTVA